jgi:hypothetical protein
MPRTSGYLAVFTLAVVSALFNQSAAASLLAYDGFSPSFPIYANSGNGFSTAWTQGGFNAFASGYALNERSLCKSGLQTSGGSVSGGAFQSINGALRSLSQALGGDNTTAYLGFLIQPNGTLNAGIFNGFFGITLNGSLGNDLFIGKPGGGPAQYVIESRGGSGQIGSGTPAVAGRTVLLVLKAQFMPGNDVFTLYVSPEPGGPEPSSHVVKSDLDLGTVSRIGIYSSGAFTVDEIRIGTTFADVVPAGDRDDSERSEGLRTLGCAESR